MIELTVSQALKSQRETYQNQSALSALLRFTEYSPFLGLPSSFLVSRDLGRTP